MTDNSNPGPGNLAVLWTSGDRDVALNMVFMYAVNSLRRGWWEKVRLIIWGPSARLSVEDEGVRAGLEELSEAGVELVACKACADRYGVSSNLETMGVDVKYMGQPLTELIRDPDWSVISP